MATTKQHPLSNILTPGEVYKIAAGTCLCAANLALFPVSSFDSKKFLKFMSLRKWDSYNIGSKNCENNKYFNRLIYTNLCNIPLVYINVATVKPHTYNYMFFCTKKETGYVIINFETFKLMSKFAYGNENVMENIEKIILKL